MFSQVKPRTGEQDRAIETLESAVRSDGFGRQRLHLFSGRYAASAAKPRDTGLMAGQLLPATRWDLSSVAARIPAPNTAQIVKVANSARARAREAVAAEDFGEAVSVMSRLPLPR